MPNVLMSGNPTGKWFLFKCAMCDCVFEANLKEVNRRYPIWIQGNDGSRVGEMVPSIECDCPECGRNCFAEDPKGYVKEDEPHA